jgi:uncharacterized protein YbjT (DUF2867 family)
MEPQILLTGATGYIGGRLLRLLEAEGYRVRCIARKPESLRARVAPGTEVMAGDVRDIESLKPAMKGIHVAYYLVHSMGAAQGFEEMDREAASCFGDTARAQGVQKIIYLGGLSSDSEQLSPHLRSRQEVGQILRRSGVPVIEFRASIVLGSGSLSFEMIRALVERLPVMITPRWVAVRAQPIAIDDVLQYLRAAGDKPVSESCIYEIGGPQQVSYGELMLEYARQRGLRRFMISVPVLTPRLSSLWLGLITPLYARVGRKLIDSIRHASIVRDDIALRVFPICPCGMREAISRALHSEDREYAETRWSDALSSAGSVPRWGGVRFGNRIVDSKKIHVRVPPEVAFEPILRIGGSTGWYYCNWLWSLRGWMDFLIGGVGMRRGRPRNMPPKAGDTIDYWRVEAFEPEHRLLMAAEMKMPGRAWLELTVTGDATGSDIRQTAIFDPVGLLGLLYWYSIYPLHQLVFSGMLRGIARAAEISSRQE